MKQLTLDLGNMGGTLRDDGAEAVSRNEDGAWKSDTDAVIVFLASMGEPFTAEDVRASVGDPPHHPNAMGARFLKATRDGIIKRVGYVRPRRSSSHASIIGQYTGARAE